MERFNCPTVAFFAVAEAIRTLCYCFWTTWHPMSLRHSARACLHCKCAEAILIVGTKFCPHWLAVMAVSVNTWS